MKIRHLYKVSSLFVAALLLFSCAKFEEFQSEDLGDGPTVTMSLVSAGDSAISVGISSSSTGYIAAVLLPGSGNAVPEDPEVLALNNLVVSEYLYSESESSVEEFFTFTVGVEQNSTYEIMAVAANEDGVLSTVSVLEVTTNDSYGPHIIGADPGFTYDPVVDPSGVVTIYFDEPVFRGTGDISFETFFTGASGNAAETDISISGNQLVIALPIVPEYGDYLWLHWDEGALEDLSGNSVEALETVFNGSGFDGAFWRIIQPAMDFASLSPDVAVAQDAGFDIVLTFDDVVDIEDLSDGDITLSYDDGAGIVTIVEVMLADVIASGNDLTIAQSAFTPAGGSLTVNIPEDVLYIGFGNPVIAIEASWDINSTL